MITKKFLIASIVLISILQADGEMLFKSKCISCHTTTRPTDINQVVAPTIMGIMRHIKMKYPNRDSATAFMKDYIFNPSKEKSICMPQKIERFGLMPSQKGIVTSEELDIILPWIFDNFPPKGFRGMRKGK